MKRITVIVLFIVCMLLAGTYPALAGVLDIQILDEGLVEARFFV